MYSPELQSRIAIWRERLAAGTLTEAEMIEAVRALRAERVAAVRTSDASRRKAAKAAIPDADDLLGELGEI